MILKGSQRAGGAQLAAHLLNDRDNDHVRVGEVRGFISDDLHGAFKEAQAVASGTRCKQYLFSLSLNPPKGFEVSEEDFGRAADRAEQALGLEGQPRAIVYHEKEGRRHAHVVWSRIDAQDMRAINLAHFKNKLTALSRDLYIDHGWQLPDGLRPDGARNPLNFSLEEWQRAKRQGINPQEIKQVFRDAWNRSDNGQAFSNALAEYGYFLAKGDRRGVVALDVSGEVYSVARWASVKSKELTVKLGAELQLPTVEQVKANLKLHRSEQLQNFIAQVKAKHAAQREPLEQRRDTLRAAHRAERDRLQAKQQERWTQETAQRAMRLRKGLAGVWDMLSGKAGAIKQQNALEAFEGAKRDQQQRDTLIYAQLRERSALQTEFDQLRARQAQDRRALARDVVASLRQTERIQNAQERGKNRGPEPSHNRRNRGFSLDL
jgi:hypothetical protein